MSIHKSKGLEFPIVFLSGMGRRFVTKDMQKNIILHQELGFGANIVKPEKRIIYPSIPRLAVEEQLKKESLSEEMRILYVAMTRAREKLIITASSLNPEKLCEDLSRKVTAYAIETSNKLIDWIGRCVIEKNDDWEVKIWPYNSILNIAKKEEDAYETLFENIERNFLAGENYEEINRKLTWEYLYKESITLPNKISISEIKNLNSKTIEIASTPKYMEEDKKDGTHYGTVLHNIMQNIDLSTGEISYIKIPKEMEKSIKTHIDTFKESQIYERIAKSKRVYRETPFNLNIPINDIYNLGEKYESETTMIQGIIDLYFYEGDDIVLVDYKTDNVETEQELIGRYAIQLGYYKKAIEEITGKRVKETIIYSFKLKKRD